MIVPLLAVCLPVILTAMEGQAMPPTMPLLAETGAVVVRSPSCEADVFTLDPFLDSLRVELAGRGIFCCTLLDPTDGIPANTGLIVEIEPIPCSSIADRVRIAIRHPADAIAATREVFLADVTKDARPRTLSLAVAEMIRSLREEVQDDPGQAIAVPAKAPQPTSAPPSEKGAPPAATSLRLEAEARGYPTRDTLTWGARARWTRPWRSYHLAIDVGGAHARTGGKLGDVVLRVATMGLAAGPRFATKRFVADLGLRAEIGWAWLHGEPGSTDVRDGSGSDLVSSLGLRLSVESPAHWRVRAGLTLESGVVAKGITAAADGQAVSGITGYYLLAGLGMVFSP